MIKKLGRWESDAYQRYVEISRRELAYLASEFVFRYHSAHAIL